MGVRTDLMTSIKTLLAADSDITTAAGSNGVHIRNYPWGKTGSPYQGVTIHWPSQETEMKGLNKADTFVYPIMVTLVRGIKGRLDSPTNVVDLFREACKDLFHNQRLADDSKVLRMRVRMGRVVMPDRWRDNYHATQVAIVVERRERRT